MTDEPSEAELALAVLQAKFDDLRQGLENAAVPGKTPVSSSLVALSQVMIFLGFFESLRPLTGPLETLRAALDDVRRGVRAPMFEPANVATHRGADSNRERKIRAAAVVAVELLFQAGSQVASAIEQVRSKLAAAGVRLGRSRPRSISSAALAKWRERATGTGDDQFSASAVRAIRTDLEQSGEWPPSQQRALEMVDSLISGLTSEEI